MVSRGPQPSCQLLHSKGHMRGREAANKNNKATGNEKEAERATYTNV